MAFQIGELVFHLTADKPYSIIYKVVNKTTENSYSLQSSRKMPHGQYSLHYVLPEDLQPVYYTKVDRIADQFTHPKRTRRPPVKVGDIVYMLNNTNPYALCYQVIQTCKDNSFNAISSKFIPGEPHVLYGCSLSDMQYVSDKKRALIEDGHFIKVQANIPEDENEELIVDCIGKLLSTLGYPSCKQVFVDDHNTPVPPASVFEEIENDMPKTSEQHPRA